MEPGQAKDILDKLLHDLYEIPIAVVYNNIAIIIKENIELTLNINDDAIRYVRFESGIYYSSNLPSYSDRKSILYDKVVPNRNMVLHETCREELLEEIKERKELESEQKSCAFYLRTLLNKCESLRDVQALLPGAAWHLLDIKIPNEAIGPLSYSTETIEAILAEHAEEADTIKERIFLNLLLRKV